MDIEDGSGEKNKCCDSCEKVMHVRALLRRMIHLEVVGKVAGYNELGGLRAKVVGWGLIAMFEPDLRAEEDSRADPMAVAEQVFGVSSLVSGALASDVVEVIGPKGDVVVGVDLSFDIVGHSVLRGVTAELTSMAESPVRADFGRNGIADVPCDIGNVALVHVPELCVGVPFGVDLVVPGLVVTLEIIVGVLAFVEGVGAGVESVAAFVPGIVHAGGAGGGCIFGPRCHVVPTRKTRLHKPMVGELDARNDAGLGVWGPRYIAVSESRCSCLVQAGLQYPAGRYNGLRGCSCPWRRGGRKDRSKT